MHYTFKCKVTQPPLRALLNLVCKIPLLARALGLKAKRARDDRVSCIQCLIINFLKLSVDRLMAIPKTVRAFIMMYSIKYNLQSPLHH